MNISVRRATKEDLPTVLHLFDDAVAWLSDMGLEGQWGTQPFSENHQMLHRFETWIESGSLHVALGDGAILGAIVLSEEPPHYLTQVSNLNSPDAVYLEAFVTERRLAAPDTGRKLLEWAEEFATERGSGWLQLDCWAGNKALRRYYRRAGFDELERFEVGSWRGVLFEKAVCRRQK